MLYEAALVLISCAPKKYAIFYNMYDSTAYNTARQNVYTIFRQIPCTSTLHITPSLIQCIFYLQKLPISPSISSEIHTTLKLICLKTCRFQTIEYRVFKWYIRTNIFPACAKNYNTLNELLSSVRFIAAPGSMFYTLEAIPSSSHCYVVSRCRRKNLERYPSPMLPSSPLFRVQYIETA